MATVAEAIANLRGFPVRGLRCLREDRLVVALERQQPNCGIELRLSV